jgi:hypothetical protein
LHIGYLFGFLNLHLISSFFWEKYPERDITVVSELVFLPACEIISAISTVWAENRQDKEVQILTLKQVPFKFMQMKMVKYS